MLASGQGERERRQGRIEVHVSEMPEEGVTLSGEVTFAELGVEEDDLTRLPQPVRYELLLRQLGEDLLVTGRVGATVELLCDRCAEFGVHELGPEEVCHRYEKVAGEVVDLTDDLREDILISFPQTHLCSEDCAGLCHHCGANLNVESCRCAEEVGESEESAEEDVRENPFSVLDGLTL